MCKIYIINLLSSTDRRNRMKVEMRNLSLTDFEFISAINGRKLSSDDIAECYQFKKSLNITGREFSRGEIGCALSHQKTYRTLLESENEYALILEDDVDLSIDVPKILSAASRWVNSKEPRVLLLSPLKSFCTKPSNALIENYHLVDIKRAWWGLGYLINRAAARQLISVNNKIWLMADDWNEYKRHSKIQLRGLDPWVIQPVQEIASILEVDRKNKRIKKTRTFQYRIKKIRENLLMKIVELFIWRPFKGYKKHNHLASPPKNN